jgi:hypothetical protein
MNANSVQSGPASLSIPARSTPKSLLGPSKNSPDNGRESQRSTGKRPTEPRSSPDALMSVFKDPGAILPAVWRRRRRAHVRRSRTITWCPKAVVRLSDLDGMSLPKGRGYEERMLMKSTKAEVVRAGGDALDNKETASKTVATRAAAPAPRLRCRDAVGASPRTSELCPCRPMLHQPQGRSPAPMRTMSGPLGSTRRLSSRRL